MPTCGCSLCSLMYKMSANYNFQEGVRAAVITFSVIIVLIVGLEQRRDPWDLALPPEQVAEPKASRCASCFSELIHPTAVN